MDWEVITVSGSIRAKSRVARWLTEAFQPPVVVSLQLLISPIAQAGYPGTIGYGALAALFVCVLPLVVLLFLVRLEGSQTTTSATGSSAHPCS